MKKRTDQERSRDPRRGVMVVALLLGACAPVEEELGETGAAVAASSPSHLGRFSSYQGTATCLQCHPAQAMAVHASVHYQWRGSTPDLVGSSGAPAGKLGSLNDFCIYPDINWIGKLQNLDGQQTDSGCARCHAGLGAKPSPSASQEQLENIDCLICHSPRYRRKVEAQSDGSFRFVPDPARMGISALQAALEVGKPDSGICLNCHTGAGGGNNFKRGDLEEAHRDPSRDFDVHLASRSRGGAGLSCTSCHRVSSHRIAGRGSDLKPRDSSTPVSCGSSDCHGNRPHHNERLDAHTARVSCTTCHIPHFAKVAPTDMERDWSLPGEVDEAKRLYDPHMVKKSNVVPAYRFWNGRSSFYSFGEPGVPDAGSGRVVMSAPVGDLATAGSKIFAFKHHLGKQPVDPISQRLLPLKIGIFFARNDLATAVSEGVKAVGWPDNGFTFRQTERWMGLFHEVAPAAQALGCTDCHGGGRLDFAALGYTPLATRNGKPLCASCHGAKEPKGFKALHDKHVKDKKLDCSSCHSFQRASL